MLRFIPHRHNQFFQIVKKISQFSVHSFPLLLFLKCRLIYDKEPNKMANRAWLERIEDMLWAFERETKFTLRDINNNFEQIGLSFDVDFRFQFLDIILNR